MDILRPRPEKNIGVFGGLRRYLDVRDSVTTMREGSLRDG